MHIRIAIFSILSILIYPSLYYDQNQIHYSEPEDEVKKKGGDVDSPNVREPLYNDEGVIAFYEEEIVTYMNVVGHVNFIALR